MKKPAHTIPGSKVAKEHMAKVRAAKPVRRITFDWGSVIARKESK
jgi:hypothetical protein